MAFQDDKELARDRLAQANPFLLWGSVARVAARHSPLPVEFRDDVCESVGHGADGRRKIVARHPRTASDVAGLLHEIQHARLGHNGSDDPATRWRDEAEAWLGVIEEWDTGALPERDAMLHAAGEGLTGYLAQAIRDGHADLELIELHVSPELLRASYLDRLERLDAAARRDRRRAAGEYVARMNL
jgi:hypothetical protein